MYSTLHVNNINTRVLFKKVAAARETLDPGLDHYMVTQRGILPVTCWKYLIIVSLHKKAYKQKTHFTVKLNLFPFHCYLPFEEVEIVELDGASQWVLWVLQLL